MNKDSQARVLGVSSVSFDLRGRSIAAMIVKLIEFWGRHRVTLAPNIDATLVTALDALAAAVIAILAINPPGPD